LYDLDVHADLPSRCRVEAWVPRVPGIREVFHAHISPYAYVVGRRIDAARRLLLQGARPAEVATAVGFCDQAHFTRHFKRHTSTTPARYARSHAGQQ
jgi:AraC-like DNA-binding protein